MSRAYTPPAVVGGLYVARYRNPDLGDDAPEDVIEIDASSWKAAWRELRNHPGIQWIETRTTVTVTMTGPTGSEQTQGVRVGKDRPQLSDLTPAGVAEQVGQWITEHVVSTLLRIDPSTDLPHLPGWQGIDGARAAHVLTHYAQTGEPPGDAPIAEYLQSVGEALWTAADPAVYSLVPYPWSEGAGEPDSAIAVVLCAVQCREGLQSGSAVSVRELAALASVREATIRQLSSRGDGPPVRDGAVAAKAAREWLSGRGIET